MRLTLIQRKELKFGGATVKATKQVKEGWRGF